jgi:hypothetical protein
MVVNSMISLSHASQPSLQLNTWGKDTFGRQVQCWSLKTLHQLATRHAYGHQQ